MQSVLHGFVATNMTKIKRGTWMAPTPDKYVAAAIRTLGYAKHTTGYFPHAIMQMVINTMQVIAPEYTNGVVLKHMEQTRARALRKPKSN